MTDVAVTVRSAYRHCICLVFAPPSRLRHSLAPYTAVCSHTAFAAETVPLSCAPTASAAKPAPLPRDRPQEAPPADAAGLGITAPGRSGKASASGALPDACCRCVQAGGGWGEALSSVAVPLMPLVAVVLLVGEHTALPCASAAFRLKGSAFACGAAAVGWRERHRLSFALQPADRPNTAAVGRGAAAGGPGSISCGPFSLRLLRLVAVWRRALSL